MKLGLDFETFQEDVVKGVLAACTVVYTAVIADVDTEEVIGQIRVAAEKDELIDFERAVSEEACTPIAEEIESELDDDQEVFALVPKFIMTKCLNDDGSLTYVSVSADGRTAIYNMTAQQVLQEMLTSLFED